MRAVRYATGAMSCMCSAALFLEILPLVFAPGGGSPK